MKKFGKIDLQNEVVLSDNEMKQVLGGSGSSSTRGSGADGKLTNFRCVCSKVDSSKVESGTIPSPEKTVEVAGKSIMEAARLAEAKCTAVYTQVDCSEI